jgi:hypothetical protein
MANSMSAQHTPGPWVVQMLTKPQPRRFHVARQVEDGTWSSPHWEQLRDADGACARFETSDDARAAIAKATGSAS